MFSKTETVTFHIIDFPIGEGVMTKDDIDIYELIENINDEKIIILEMSGELFRIVKVDLDASTIAMTFDGDNTRFIITFNGSTISYERYETGKGGTTTYGDLIGKPSINGVTVVGSKDGKYYHLQYNIDECPEYSREGLPDAFATIEEGQTFKLTLSKLLEQIKIEMHREFGTMTDDYGDPAPNTYFDALTVKDHFQSFNLSQSIPDTNQSTTKYPSEKAVAVYVAEHGSGVSSDKIYYIDGSNNLIINDYDNPVSVSFKHNGVDITNAEIFSKADNGYTIIARVRVNTIKYEFYMSSYDGFIRMRSFRIANAVYDYEIDISGESSVEVYKRKLPSAGATDYNDLTNKPKINGVTLTGNKESYQIGLEPAILNDPTITSNPDNFVVFDEGYTKKLGWTDFKQLMHNEFGTMTDDYVDPPENAYFDAITVANHFQYKNISQSIPDTNQSTFKYPSEKAVADYVTPLKEDITLMNTATSSDVGKALSPKTVADGKVTEWQFKEITGGSELEVINSVTITEESSIITINRDSNGNEFDLKVAYIIVDLLSNPNNAEANTNVWVYCGESGQAFLRVISTITGTKNNDRFFSTIAYSDGVASSFMCSLSPSSHVGLVNNKYIKYFSVESKTAGNAFSVGSRVSIMGVRA